MAATIQRQQNLLDATEINLTIRFWRLGVAGKSVHEEIALGKVGVMVEGLDTSCVEGVRRIGRENLLAVETETKTDDGIVGIVVWELVCWLNHEEEFTHGILEIQVEHGVLEVRQEADGLVLALCNHIVKAGLLEPFNFWIR